MATTLPAMQPIGCLRPICREFRKQKVPKRFITTSISLPKKRVPFPQEMPEQFKSQIPQRMQPRQVPKKITVYPPPPRPKSKEPVKDFTTAQLSLLDPTGERKEMFDRKNRKGLKVGDILRVTFKDKEPFSGVCLNIRQRGVDTSFLLRNKLVNVSVEMWIKVFSPNTQSVELVQRSEKKVRRARLTYMRKPKHDKGSVENIVRDHLRKKAGLAGSELDRFNKARK